MELNLLTQPLHVDSPEFKEAFAKAEAETKARGNTIWIWDMSKEQWSLQTALVKRGWKIRVGEQLATLTLNGNGKVLEVMRIYYTKGKNVRKGWSIVCEKAVHDSLTEKEKEALEPIKKDLATRFR